jgi:TolB protein
MQPDGTQRHVVIDIGEDAFGPSWSPDGTKILFTGTGSGDRDVWIADSDGENATNLTVGSLDDDHALGWAPDGTVIFASDRSRNGGNFVYAMRADGSDVRLVVII